MASVVAKANALEKLQQAYALLKEGRWTRGAAAKSSDGRHRHPTEVTATQFDVLGALGCVCVNAPEAYAEALRLLYLSLPPVYREDHLKLGYVELRAKQQLIEWNDGVADVFAVFRLFEDAIAEAKQGDLF